MPLLVAQRNTHGVVALDHHHGGSHKTATTAQTTLTKSEQQPLDFTMSKFKSTSGTRHQLYRQFYGAEDSPPYDKHEETGNLNYINEYVSKVSFLFRFKLIRLENSEQIPSFS